MYKNNRVEVVVPAGREISLSILTKYLLKHKDIIDKVQIWKNTRDPYDVAYINSLKSDFFEIKEFVAEEYIDPKSLNISTFFGYAQNPDTIYIRFDDDMVYIHDDYFKNILDFRLEHPEYFLVFGNIWNNSITSFIQQRLDRIGTEMGIVSAEECQDDIGWKSPEFAEYIHKIMIKKIQEGKVEDLYIPNWLLLNNKRFSVGNFCYFGRDLAANRNGVRFPQPDADEIGVHVQDEEAWFTRYYPKKIGRLNVVCGNAVCVHFAFYVQRDYLMKQTNLLDEYKQLCEAI